MGELYDEICSMENLNLTFDKLRKKNKRSGPDGVDWESVNIQRTEYLNRLHKQLVNVIYMPDKDIYKEKPYFPGSDKTLYYVEMNIRDKIVEYAIKNVAYPILDREWCDFSCAYRKSRGEPYADYLLDKYKQAGCDYFVSVDIKSYYNSIVNSKLKNTLLSALKDSQCVDLILSCLHIKDKRTGIPIGHVLSTICGNAYLQPVDITLIGKNVIRYADNYCFAAKSEDNLQLLVKMLEKELLALELTLNQDKTRVVYLPQSIRDVMI